MSAQFDRPMVFARCAALAAVLALPVQVSAQAGSSADPDDAAPRSVSQPVVQAIPAAETMSLNSALGRLARNPRDVAALLDAGKAAAAMGDFDAAIGFYQRADQLSPGNMQVKAGMAGAMTRSGNPFDAIPLFAEVERAGPMDATFVGDCGLAYDLVGDPFSAQSYYKRSLGLRPDDEVSRRLALSLAIAGDQRGMETMLSALLLKQDKAAWRTRAFSLAILGKPDEAEAIANSTMPKELAAGIAPYLRFMPKLTPAQQVAAANFGHFPRAADIGRDDPRVLPYAKPVRSATALAAVDKPLTPTGQPLGRSRRDNERRSDSRRDRGKAVAVAPPPVPQPTRQEAAAPATTVAPPPKPVATLAVRDVPPTPRPAAPAVIAVPPAPTPPPTATAVVRPAISMPAPPVVAATAPLATPVQASVITSAVMPQPAVGVPVQAAVVTASVPVVVTPAVNPPVATVATIAAPAEITPPVSGPSASNPASPGFATLDGPPGSGVGGFDLAKVGTTSAAAPAVSVPAPAPAATPVPTPPAAPIPPRRASLAEAFADLAAPSTVADPAAGAVDIRRIVPSRPAVAAVIDPKTAEKAPAKPAHPSRIWVQLATGRDKAALGFDWRRMGREAETAFRGKQAHVSAWGQSNRLLAGPFESEAAANAFLALLRRANVSGAFLWTSPAGQVVDRLVSR